VLTRSQDDWPLPKKTPTSPSLSIHHCVWRHSSIVVDFRGQLFSLLEPFIECQESIGALFGDHSSGADLELEPHGIEEVNRDIIERGRPPQPHRLVIAPAEHPRFIAVEQSAPDPAIVLERSQRRILTYGAT